MEMDDVWVLNALQGILPEQTLQLVHDHILHPSSTFRLVSSHAMLGVQHCMRALTPLVSPIIERLIRLLHDSPDVVFVGFILALFFAFFQLLLFMQRAVSYFTRLMFRAILWTLIGLAIMAVWRRGPEAVAADIVVLVRGAMRYAQIVKDIWLSEYQKYDAQTRGGGIDPATAAAAGPGSRAAGGSMASGRGAGYRGGRWQ
ncbi:hypothetical protein F4777DRAFT_561717 [Nemania sp. FL0916]|nr:hypothetical protein F4777DRAFT_561717 [Nemania sp. FL0916]